MTSLLDTSMFLFLVASYMIASIPFSLILVRLIKHIDIRNYGSGNVGATNAFRVAGVAVGSAVFAADFMKAFLPVLITKVSFDHHLHVVFFLVVAAHIFPVYLKFRGGRGVASTIAALFAIDYRIAALCAITWLSVFSILRISAIASISAFCVAMPIIFIISFFLGLINIKLLIAGLLVSLLVFIRHIPNITKLLVQRGKIDKTTRNSSPF